MPVDGEDFDGLGVQEVARQLGVHEQTLRRWIWRGKIKATRSQTGRSYRWLVSADPDLPLPADRLDPPQVVEPTDAEDDDREAYVSPPASRVATMQRDRISAIEEQIEKEIQRLTDQASAIHIEVERLYHTLRVLRSDDEP